MFYGWRHTARGSSATKWFTLFYLPIMPISRAHLSPSIDFERERFAKSTGEIAAALAGYGSRTDLYRVGKETPLQWAEIAATYVKAYVALPLLIVWPWLLLYLSRQSFGVHPEWEEQAWFTPAVVVFVGIALMNAVVVPMWAIQSARGYKGGLFRRRQDVHQEKS